MCTQTSTTWQQRVSCELDRCALLQFMVVRLRSGWIVVGNQIFIVSAESLLRPKEQKQVAWHFRFALHCSILCRSCPCYLAPPSISEIESYVLSVFQLVTSIYSGWIFVDKRFEVPDTLTTIALLIIFQYIRSGFGSAKSLMPRNDE